MRRPHQLARPTEVGSGQPCRNLAAAAAAAAKEGEVDQGEHGWAAVGALEGESAAREGLDKPAALHRCEGVPEHDGAPGARRRQRWRGQQRRLSQGWATRALPRSDTAATRVGTRGITPSLRGVAFAAKIWQRAELRACDRAVRGRDMKGSRWALSLQGRGGSGRRVGSGGGTRR
jgi:hypothetical protein